MSTKTMTMSSVLALAAVATAGTVITGSDVYTVATEGEVTVQPVTVAATAEPADLPTPVFHFDATRSDDWTFDAKKATVSKIPSLVGGHYLTSTLESGTWQIANGSNYAALYLSSVDELGGKPAISFGNAVNTCRALWFDPVDAGEGGTVTNILRNIGTVVAVHKMLDNTANCFMGGGFIVGSALLKTDTNCVGSNWSRETSAGLGGYYWSPMFYGYRGPMGGNFAFHDGLKTDATAAGFSGKWEVTIFQPTEAKWEASGIGVNGVPSWAYSRGGGAWAELYVFDQVVGEDVLQRLNAYLQAKWFGDVKTGYNGVARVGRQRPYRNAWDSVGATNVVDVSTGMTLTIDRLAGGRGTNAKLIKRGAGTLKIHDAANFGGDIDLEQGRLDLTTKSVPLTRDDLPAGLSYCFDASDLDSMTLEGEETQYLRRWQNKTENTVKSGSTVYARAAGDADSRRPILIPNALGAGLNVLDFGKYNTANTTDAARYLDFVYSADGTSFTVFNPQSVYTVVAFMGAQRCGGNLVANGNESTFSRHEQNVDWMTDADFTAPILRSCSTKVSYAKLYPTNNACVMIDGTVIDSQKGHETPEYQVLGIRTSAQSIKCIGGTGTRNGGLRLGEILIWQRPLKEEEMRDVEAYLTKKWLKRDMAGYHSEGHVLADARSVVAAGESEIYVPEGTTARIEALTANAAVVKKGAGTLEVGPFGKAGAGTLTVAEGAVRPVAAQDVVTDASAPAIGASLHLDASDADSVYYKPDATGYAVRIWNDKEHKNAAYMYTSGREPVCDTENGVMLNGKPVMDLMPDSTARAFTLAKSLDGVRAAFVVWQPADAGCILGSCSTRDANANRVDFCRGNDGKDLIIDNPGATLVGQCSGLYTNGVKVAKNPNDFQPENVFQLTELYPSASAHTSALGLERGGWRGNCRYAEIILYERELSEREKVATRNYLMKKWFNAEPQELPAAPAVALTGNLAYAADATWDVAVKSDGTADVTAITGTLSFGAGATINLTGLGALGELAGRKIVIARAGAYAGVQNVTVTGDVAFTSADQPYAFVKSNGDLVVRFGKLGTLIICR